MRCLYVKWDLASVFLHKVGFFLFGFFTHLVCKAIVTFSLVDCSKKKKLGKNSTI